MSVAGPIIFDMIADPESLEDYNLKRPYDYRLKPTLSLAVMAFTSYLYWHGFISQWSGITCMPIRAYLRSFAELHIPGTVISGRQSQVYG